MFIFIATRTMVSKLLMNSKDKKTIGKRYKINKKLAFYVDTWVF